MKTEKKLQFHIIDSINKPLTKKINKNIIHLIGEYLFEIPNDRRTSRNNIIFAILALVVLGVLLLKLNVFSYNVDITAHALDLSGVWKIELSDSPSYAGANFDDSNWCNINVPTPNVILTQPLKTCFGGAYPVDKMRNNTYWYRKTFTIQKDFVLSEPSLFLGSVKQRGFVYFDGNYIGAVSNQQTPNIIILEKKLLSAGEHHLAIRVQSFNEEYPGIMHRYNKLINLGEFSDNLDAKTVKIITMDVQPYFVAAIQIMALLMLLIFMVRSHGTNETFFWLGLYFAATASNAIRVFFLQQNNVLATNINLLWMSFALLGYGYGLLNYKRSHIYFTKRLILAVGILLSLSAIYLYRYLPAEPSAIKIIKYGILFVPLVLTIFNIAKYVISRKTRKRIYWTEISILLILSIIHLSYICEVSPMLKFVPTVFFSSFLTLFIILLSIEEYVRNVKQLAFFGRFIRKGLKNILSAQSGKFFLDEKVFRGRRIPIMKIDVVNHTKTTFSMPYGVKRLFQDLWFTHIDYIVSEKIFLDKNEGDGSIYYFEEDIEGGSCTAALQAAFQVKEIAVKQFDDDFNNKLSELLKITPELEYPMNNYMQRYELAMKEKFEKRKTQIRIALVYGFVDEGLWGLTSQSHYDVQGDLVTFLARTEKNALANEIILNEDFTKQLKLENEIFFNSLQLEWRIVELKGIGNKKLALLKGIIGGDARKAA